MSQYTVEGQSTVLAGATLNIRPSTDAEWIIHNIYIPNGNPVSIYRWNDIGSTPNLLITKTSTSMLCYSFHCTVDNYISIVNLGASSIYVAYDGVILE